MKHPNSIIKEFRVTEKATELSANFNQYTFEVDPRVSRTEVAQAVKDAFDVTVTRVNILNTKGKAKRDRQMRGRYGRTAKTKKAIVTLKAGDKIELV